MNKTIKYAGVAGILSLIFGVPVTVFEVLRSLKKLDGDPISLYIFVLFLSLVLYIVFIHGFRLVGEKLSNNLLKLTSNILIILAIVSYGYLILTLISPNLDNEGINILIVVFSGAASITFGISLLKLKPQFGSLATWAGVIAIITGAGFLSVIWTMTEIFLTPLYILSSLFNLSLFIITILLLIPLRILLLMILFRAAKKFKQLRQSR